MNILAKKATKLCGMLKAKKLILADALVEKSPLYVNGCIYPPIEDYIM